MPVNKLASFRYRVINNCLQNKGRSWSRVRIMQEIEEQLYNQFGIDKGISKRTFHYDIEIMRSDPPRGFGAPIEIVDGCYRYNESNYSIDKIGLNEKDIEGIKGAVELLSHYKQLPIHSQLSLVQDKVTGQILANDTNEPIIELEHREVQGSEYLGPLYNYIKEQTVIKLGYLSFSASEVKEHILHPYFLKQYNHRWYLMALNKEYNNLGTYSLDRVKKITAAPDMKFDNSLNHDHAKRFRNIFGVTLMPEEEPVEIIAFVSSRQAPYVRTKKLHSSQVIIEEDEKGMTISLNIIPNYEFYSTIMSTGDGIKILSPPSVREEIFKRIEASLNQY